MYILIVLFNSITLVYICVLCTAGYDNYPGYPYIDETPTDPDRYFQEQEQEYFQGREGDPADRYFKEAAEESFHRNNQIMSGECK